MTHPSNRRWPLAAAALIALAAAPAVAKKPVPDAGWQKFTPDAQVVGVDGNTYAPSCTGFPGTDPTFKFWAKKSPTGSRKTMVYFEGGGACWDNFTCSFPLGTGLPAPVLRAAGPARHRPGDDGWRLQGRPGQPGQGLEHRLHPVLQRRHPHRIDESGSITTSVSRSFPVGTPFTLQHRGFDNFMSVLAWMKASGDKPQQILVTGSSAGGYGATANFPWIAETFKSARVSLLADASQGVTTTAFDTGTPGRNSWNPQLAPWVFGPPPSAARGGELISLLAAAYPQSKIAQFTTPLDGVQIGFYGVMKQFYGPGGSCPNPAADWNQQMLADLKPTTASTPNFRHYVAAGNYHTIMRSPLYYTEARPGPNFAGWLGNMLADQGGTGGQGRQVEERRLPDLPGTADLRH